MGGGGEPGENEKERIDRELIELLNELRVALPGVEVLFAFLLILPFSNGFQRVTALQRNVYFGTFLCAAVAMLLFIAPTSYHRLRFRARDKKRILFTSNRLTITALGFLALAITGSVFLISDVLFGVPTAVTVAGAIGLGFAWFWYGMPLSRALRGRRSGAAGDSGGR